MKRKFRMRLQPKLLIALIMMGIILASAIIYFFTTLFGALMEEFYSQSSYAQTSIAADVIDAQSIKNYYNNGVVGEKDDYYKEINDYLLSVQDNMGLIYYRIVIPDGDGMVVIWDTGISKEDNANELGKRLSCTEEEASALKKAFKPDAERTVVGGDEIDTVYSPILDSAGQPVALAAVGFSMERVYIITAKFMLVTLVVTAIIIIFISILYHLFVKMILIRPLKKLHHAVSGLVSDNMEKLDEFNVDIKSRDEVGDLADAFRHMSESLTIT